MRAIVVFAEFADEEHGIRDHTPVVRARVLLNGWVKIRSEDGRVALVPPHEVIEVQRVPRSWKEQEEDDG